MALSQTHTREKEKEPSYEHPLPRTEVRSGLVSDLYISWLRMCGTLNQAFLFLCPEQEELLEVRLTDLLQTHRGKAKREKILKPPLRYYGCKKEIGKGAAGTAKGGPHLERRR